MNTKTSRTNAALAATALQFATQRDDAAHIDELRSALAHCRAFFLDHQDVPVSLALWERINAALGDAQ